MERMTTRLIVLTLLLASVAACGGSTSTPTSPSVTPAPTTSGTSVAIVPGASVLTSTAYNPDPINVSPGTTVTWVNNDTTTHTSVANGGAWNSGNIGPGGSFSATFPTAGSFTYHCAIHPNMVGTVNVQ
jgi:plastocyanin